MAGPGAKTTPFDSPKLRLDKWLWQARFFKGRDLAADVVLGGHLRLNGQRCTKPGHAVAVGDVLTFPQGSQFGWCGSWPLVSGAALRLKPKLFLLTLMHQGRQTAHPPLNDADTSFTQTLLRFKDGMLS